jgi:hypothetical protein
MIEEGFDANEKYFLRVDKENFSLKKKLHKGIKIGK